MISPTLIATIVLATLLMAVAMTDLRTYRIPNALNAAMAVLGLLAARALERPVSDHLIGIAAGYLGLFAVNAVYRSWRGRDGIGMGDAKFMAAAGAWLGWYALPFVALIGATLAIAVVAMARLGGRRLTRDSKVAFGPFLAAGVAAAWAVIHLRDLPGLAGSVR